MALLCQCPFSRKWIAFYDSIPSLLIFCAFLKIVFEKINDLNSKDDVLLMSLAETIKELGSFILKGVDLIADTSTFLLHSINHCVMVKNYTAIDSA